MRIVIDLQGAQSPHTRDRGIGRYSLGLAKAVLRNRGEHEVHVALNGALPETIQPIVGELAHLLPRDRIHSFSVLEGNPDNPGDARRQASEMCREAFLNGLNPDAVHVCSMVEGIRGSCVASIGRLVSNVPTSATFYDAIPLIYPSRYLSDQRAIAWYDARMEQLRRADRLLAISASSAREAVDHLSIDPDRVVTVGTAADPVFRPQAAGGAKRARFLERFGITRPYVMYTGGIDFRKNVETLLAAFAALPGRLAASHQSVIVCECSEADERRLQQLAREQGYREDALVLTGAISDRELASLYTFSKLFVFPSLHEGFGLPLLEAMQCGAPVLGSNRSSIPEVIGREDALFDPRDPDALANSMAAALADDARRDELKLHAQHQAKKFSWDAVGQRAVAALETMVRQRRAATPAAIEPHAKPRLAYVSPMPPDWSGIAAYSLSILPGLSRFYDIDLVVDAGHDALRSAGFLGVKGVIDPSTFRKDAQNYDRVLYQIGNSEFHDYMLPLIEAVKGVVVVHDFFVGGLIRHHAFQNAGEADWLAALYDSQGVAAVYESLHSGPPGDATLHYPCLASIVEKSTGLIVHSAYAQGLARDWLAPAAFDRVALVPLPCPIPRKRDRASARARLGIAPEARLICSFGRMGPTKCNIDLLRAWLSSAAGSDPDCSLVFVGAPADGDYGEEFSREIADNELGGRVIVTGWVDDGRYEDWMSAADLAVQLRTRSKGESSLAVLECLAHGVPTIANAHGSVAELPANALALLPDRFEEAQLREAIDAVRLEAEVNGDLSEAGPAYIKAEHDPADVAARLRAHIEPQHEREVDLFGALKDLVPFLSTEEKERLAEAAGSASYVPSAQTVFLDVSELDLGLGTAWRDRLMGTLRALMAAWPRRLRLRLVRFDGATFVHAHAALGELISQQRVSVEELPVDLAECDLFVRVGTQPFVAPRDMLQLKTIFLLDDVRSAWTNATVDETTRSFDNLLAAIRSSGGAICSSESLADELRACLVNTGYPSPQLTIAVAPAWLADDQDEVGVRQLVQRIAGFLPASGSHSENGRPGNHGRFMSQTELLQ